MKRLLIIVLFLAGLISLPTLSAKKQKKQRPVVRIEMNVPADLQAKMTPDLQSPAFKIDGPKRLECLSDEVISKLVIEPTINRRVHRDPLESIIVFVTTGPSKKKIPFETKLHPTR